MIQISVNNKIHSIEASASLAALLANLLPNSKGVAIAVNEKVISESKWAELILVENDQILIIQATQGG